MVSIIYFFFVKYIFIGFKRCVYCYVGNIRISFCDCFKGRNIVDFISGGFFSCVGEF